MESPTFLPSSVTRDGRRSGIRGIVFDAVGTLIQPEPSVAAAYVASARLQGVRLDEAEVRRRFRRHFDAEVANDLAHRLATDEARERQRWRRIVSQVLPELPDLDSGFGWLWEHFGRPDAWRCFDDVAPTLRALRTAGLAVRIGSNFDARLRQVVRGLPDLADLADRLVISSEVGFRKPHPALYQAACDSLGLPPEQVLWVGDDPENDFQGPRRAGLRAVLVDRDGRAPDDLPRAPDLRALADLLTD